MTRLKSMPTGKTIYNYCKDIIDIISEFNFPDFMAERIHNYIATAFVYGNAKYLEELWMDEVEKPWEKMIIFVENQDYSWMRDFCDIRRTKKYIKDLALESYRSLFPFEMSIEIKMNIPNDNDFWATVKERKKGNEHEIMSIIEWIMTTEGDIDSQINTGQAYEILYKFANQLFWDRKKYTKSEIRKIIINTLLQDNWEEVE